MERIKKSITQFILPFLLIPLISQKILGANEQETQETLGMAGARIATRQFGLTSPIAQVKQTLKSLIRMLDICQPNRNISEQLQPWFSALNLACQVGDYSLLKDIFNSGLFTDEQKKQLLTRENYQETPIKTNLPEDSLLITWLSNPHNYEDYFYIGSFLLGEMKRLQINFNSFVRCSDNATMGNLLAHHNGRLSPKIRKRVLKLLISAGADTSYWKRDEKTFEQEFLKKRRDYESTEAYKSRRFTTYQESINTWNPHKKAGVRAAYLDHWNQESPPRRKLLHSILSNDFYAFKRILRKYFRNINPTDLTELLNEPIDVMNNTLLTYLASGAATFENHMILVECLRRGARFDRVFKDQNLEDQYGGSGSSDQKKGFVERQINRLDPDASYSDLFYGMNKNNQTASLLAAQAGKAEALWHLSLANAPANIGYFETMSGPAQWTKLSLLDLLKSNQTQIPELLAKQITGYTKHFCDGKDKKYPPLSEISIEEKQARLNKDLSPLQSYMPFAQQLRRKITSFKKGNIRETYPKSDLLEEQILYDINEDLLQRYETTQGLWYHLCHLKRTRRTHPKTVWMISGTAIGIMTGIFYNYFKKS